MELWRVKGVEGVALRCYQKITVMKATPAWALVGAP